MRRPLIAGNWKMNTDPETAFELMDDMLEHLDVIEEVDVVVCPPFVSLETFADLFDSTSLFLGAQNMYWEERGAYTGEISPLMLKGMCDYVILGHSERRQYFAETDEDVKRKVQAALAHGLRPIVCVGENLEERENGHTLDVVHRQIDAALTGPNGGSLNEAVIAYEPVWAIGTGVAATDEGANEVIGAIRARIAALHGDMLAGEMRILYGGSVNAANISEFIAQPEIDGALVGGASLDPEAFVRIVATAQELKRVRPRA